MLVTALPSPHPLARDTPRNMEGTKELSKRAAEKVKKKLKKAKKKEEYALDLNIHRFCPRQSLH